MDRAFKVIFFDSLRVPHEALVTNWFHGGPDGQTEAALQQLHDERQALLPVERRSPTFYRPCCNLVYVTEDKAKVDPYGRQLERQTSCAYGRHQHVPMLGMCWCWPDELEEAMALAAEAITKGAVK